MMNDPPHSPGVVELVDGAIADLNAVFRARFNVDLYGDYRPNERDLSYLSVGPLTRVDEVLQLAAILYGWVIENMRSEALREALRARATFDGAWRQIRLLEEVLRLLAVPESQIQRIGQPLRGLNDLRQEHAHIGISRMTEVIRRIGVDLAMPLRVMWNTCVDVVINTMRATAAAAGRP